jgi:hypothetical protein
VDGISAQTEEDHEKLQVRVVNLWTMTLTHYLLNMLKKK